MWRRETLTVSCFQYTTSSILRPIQITRNTAPDTRKTCIFCTSRGLYDEFVSLSMAVSLLVQIDCRVSDNMIRFEGGW